MYTYTAKVTKIIDGDTLDVDIDAGFNVHIHERVRLFGINTPEVFGAKAKDPVERERGHAAKAFVESWLEANTLVWTVALSSYDAKKLSQEKYGRWLAVISPLSGGTSLNDALIEAGLADKYA